VIQSQKLLLADTSQIDRSVFPTWRRPKIIASAINHTKIPNPSIAAGPQAILTMVVSSYSLNLISIEARFKFHRYGFFHWNCTVDKGFGLISILSGIGRGSLNSLAGAGLSGELVENVKLVIQPTQENQKGLIEYYVTSTSTQTRNGRMVGKIMYY
jgi:hypothetical protein